MRYCVAWLLCVLLGAPAWAAQPAEFEGRWQTVDDETGKPRSVVELRVEKKRLFGTIVELSRAVDDDPDPLCEQCRGALGKQKILGMTILDGLRWNGSEWMHGAIVDPAKGKHYDAKIWLEDDDSLKVRGYLGIFFHTQTWHRVR